MAQRKRWCLTINNYDRDQIQYRFQNNVRLSRYVYQEERGDRTGHSHIQAYVEYKNRTRFGTVQADFPGAHIERALGSAWQNFQYCTKEDSRVNDGINGQRGEFTEPRSSVRDRTKLEYDEAISDIKEGKSVTQIARAYPKLFLRHSVGIPILINHMAQIPVQRNLTVILLQGPSGTGKSYWAMQYCAWHKFSFYNKPAGKWWGNYSNQEVVIMNDMDKDQVDYRVLLNWLDIYTCDLDVKGGQVKSTYHTVIMTTNKQIDYWYEQEVSALARRINHTLVCDSGQYATEIHDYKHVLPGTEVLPFNLPPGNNLENVADFDINDGFEIEDMI